MNYARVKGRSVATQLKNSLQMNTEKFRIEDISWHTIVWTASILKCATARNMTICTLWSSCWRKSLWLYGNNRAINYRYTLRGINMSLLVWPFGFASRIFYEARCQQTRSMSAVLRLFVSLDVYFLENKVRNIITRYANIDSVTPILVSVRYDP